MNDIADDTADQIKDDIIDIAAAPEGKDLGDLDHEYKAETADEAVDKDVELLPE